MWEDLYWAVCSRVDWLESWKPKPSQDVAPTNNNENLYHQPESHINWDTFFPPSMQSSLLSLDEQRASASLARRTFAEKRSRATEYRAPSWSFAALDAGILYHALNGELTLAKCIECHVDLAGNDPFGELKGGSIIIQVGHLSCGIHSSKYF
jgi:hypothetical protein